jgi:hypothetical protein
MSDDEENEYDYAEHYVTKTAKQDRDKRARELRAQGLTVQIDKDSKIGRYSLYVTDER